MTWRWDQGRLEYFRVQNIRKIAQVLEQFDGVVIKGVPEDLLRNPLRVTTNLSYPPENNPSYKIWRNFGRVFGQSLLATTMPDGRLRVSEVCRGLAQATDSISDEQYMQFLVKRHTMPSPSFEGYDKSAVPVFPFCALIKLALARLSQGAPLISSNDAADYLVANKSVGDEDLAYYRNLKPRPSRSSADTLRQIREMMAILGQIPFLKWEASGLSIDKSALGSSFEADIMAYATPSPMLPRLDKFNEVLNMGSIGTILLPALELPESSPEEESFIEGSRKRVTHVRIERSGRLRQIYMANTANPSLCDMCISDMKLRYPWTNSLIEVHHLLPLGSLLRVEPKTTSLRDVVGVCPSCHKATHQFYRVWLTQRKLEDFRNEDEARAVYSEAKQSVIIAA